MAMSGSSARITAAAVSPSTVYVGGIRMSVITNSGRKALVIRQQLVHITRGADHVVTLVDQ